MIYSTREKLRRITMTVKETCSKFIREIKALEEEISRLRKDSLTGAYTRVYLDTLVTEKYQPKLEARRSYFYNVYFFDLNNLHTINREEGYYAGDQYILDSVNYIRKVFKGSKYKLFRIGGDEFVVISEPFDRVVMEDLQYPKYTVVHGIWTREVTFHEVISRLDKEIIKLKKGRSKYIVEINDDKLYNKVMALIEKEAGKN